MYGLHGNGLHDGVGRFHSSLKMKMLARWVCFASPTRRAQARVVRFCAVSGILNSQRFFGWMLPARMIRIISQRFFLCILRVLVLVSFVHPCLGWGDSGEGSGAQDIVLAKKGCTWL